MANKGMSVFGAKELEQVFKQLPNELNVKILKAVNREGAKVYKSKMESNTPVGNDRIKIKIANDKTNLTSIWVGVNPKQWWARWIEFGTKQRRTKGRGPKQFKKADRGKMNPRAFISPAIEAVTNQAIKAIFDNMGRTVNNFLKRETRKVNKAAKR